jgi:hypothetical protein
VFSVLTLVVTQGTGTLGIESAAFVTGIAMTGLLYRAPLLWLSVLYGIGVIGVLAYWRWPYWVADSTQSANLTAALGFVLLYAVTGALIGMLKSRLDKTWLELSQNRAHLARNVEALAVQVAERERAEQIARGPAQRRVGDRERRAHGHHGKTDRPYHRTRSCCIRPTRVDALTPRHCPPALLCPARRVIGAYGQRSV